MKKYLFIVLALLLTFGVANATNIPQMVDPKSYPTVWTEVVYNGSGATIVSGYIVEWDFEASDSAINYNDDMSMWVQTCDGASDIWTAGVVPYGNNIADGDVGAIIIRGPAYVIEYLTTPPTANELAGSHTNGQVTADSGSGNTTSLGITIDASPSYAPNGETGSWSIVFIDPTSESD